MLFIGFYDPERLPLTARLLYTLKHSPDRAASAVFARAMSAALTRRFLSCGEKPSGWRITYLPRTPAALRRDGFDHGRRLAALCARSTGARLCTLLDRSGAEEQKTLDAQGRRENAEASLRLRRGASVRGEKIILCDDVVTSGATAARAARLLLAEGAEAVFLLTALRTGQALPPASPEVP